MRTIFCILMLWLVIVGIAVTVDTLTAVLAEKRSKPRNIHGRHRR